MRFAFYLSPYGSGLGGALLVGPCLWRLAGLLSYCGHAILTCDWGDFQYTAVEVLPL